MHVVNPHNPMEYFLSCVVSTQQQQDNTSASTGTVPFSLCQTTKIYKGPK